MNWQARYEKPKKKKRPEAWFMSEDELPDSVFDGFYYDTGGTTSTTGF